MANNENKQTTPTPAADPKDDLIAQLQAQLEAEQAKNKEKDAQLADANAKAAEAQKELADMKTVQEKASAAKVQNTGKVTIKLYKDQNIKDDVQVFVNGRQYIIKRGVSVDVPREVFEVLQNQEKMRDHIAAYNEEHEQK